MNPHRWLLVGLSVAGAVLCVILLAPRPIQPPSAAPSAPAATPTPRPLTTLPDAEPAATIDTPSKPAGRPVDAILTDQAITHDQAALEIYRQITSLPPDEQEEAAYHVANLSSDETAAIWAKDVAAQSLPEEVEDVLLADLFNRPETVFYPTLAAIADRASHRKRQEAVDTLEILVGPLPAGQVWSAHVARTLAAEQAEQP